MNETKLAEDRDKPLEKNLLLYIWRYTKRDQFWILFIILISMPTYWMVFELPKQIINGPIQGNGFADSRTVRFLDIEIGLPNWLGGYSFDIFNGFDLTRTEYLFALSFAFLAMVCVNGLLKFYVNTYKGRLGERMLRRIRYQLVDRVLRFPMRQFNKVKGSEIASMVKDEVEPFGEFIGDALNQPFLLGSQALIAFSFIFLQSAWLGLLTIITVSLQVGIIPMLRKRVLELGRKRQVTARQLSGRIGEEVESITAIRVNDTSNYERAEVAERLGHIFNIRYELFQRKFFAKFVSNFLGQFTPFLFYLVGGYFAIRGSLDIGQLIAAIGAYKELPSPINGLIMWDQKRMDINLKYGQIIDNFNIEDLVRAEMQAPCRDMGHFDKGLVEINNLGVVDDTGATVLEDINLSFQIPQLIAAVGAPGSGVDVLPGLLARLREPSSGRICVDGKAISEFPDSVIGRRLGYVDSNSYLPEDSLLNILLYPLKHLPIREIELDEVRAAQRRRNLREAVLAGNIEFDLQSDWVDYEAAGVNSRDEIERKLQEILKVVEIEDLVYDLALRQTIDLSSHPELCEKIVAARARFRERLEQKELEHYVEPFDKEKYSNQATVSENVLFGTIRGNDSIDDLIQDDYFREILAITGLDRLLFELGIELAQIAVELFADLSPDNPFFNKLDFLSPAEVREFQMILSNTAPGSFETADEFARKKLLTLALRYNEPRYRLGLMDQNKKTLILKARSEFRRQLPERLNGKISFYEKETYTAGASIQDNILLGRIVTGFSEVSDQIYSEMKNMLEELGMKDGIWSNGLQFNIGSGGKRLTEAQRQKIILGRTLLKCPDLLIVNRGLTALDQQAQKRILERVVERARTGQSRFGILWALDAPTLAERFDRLLVFSGGRLAEDGTPSELMAADGKLGPLLSRED